jgi:hypothetical protein
MRFTSIAKAALLAAAVALPASFSAAEARIVKLPPGACAFGRSGVSNGALCSYNCNPSTQWCAQQICTNGALVQMIPCWGSFCSGKCP